MITIKASAILKRILRGRSPAAELTWAQWMALVHIAAHAEGTTTEDIRKDLGLSVSIVYRHTETFVKRGLATRASLKTRGLTYRFLITEEGRKLLAVAPEEPRGCAACDRGDYQLGHAHWCPKSEEVGA